MDLERLRRTEYNQQYIAAMRPVFNRRALFTDTSAEYVIPEEPEPYSSEAKCAANTALSATTDPTDKSMPPVMITSVTPTARIPYKIGRAHV